MRKARFTNGPASVIADHLSSETVAVIAKLVRRDRQPSDYGRLARYVANAPGQSDPATWTRTVDYLLDINHHGEKVGGVRITNCLSPDAAAAALEILATQKYP